MTAQLTPSQLRQFVAVCVVQQWALLVTGPPGGGKSDIIAQGVADAGADSIVSHPVVSDMARSSRGERNFSSLRRSGPRSGGHPPNRMVSR